MRSLLVSVLLLSACGGSVTKEPSCQAPFPPGLVAAKDCKTDLDCLSKDCTAFSEVLGTGICDISGFGEPCVEDFDCGRGLYCVDCICR